MLDTLNRHFVQPLIAAKRRSRHLRNYRHLIKTQFDSPDTVRARQLSMLKAQLRHAYVTVPFYRRTWAAAPPGTAIWAAGPWPRRWAGPAPSS